MRYRVAETLADYDACRKLMTACGMSADIGYPSLMAISNEGLIGLMGTQPRSDMILAGPLCLRPDKRRVFTAMRLVLMYERVLHNLGISSFIFHVDETDSFFFQVMERYFLDLKPYAKKGTMLFYIWRIDVADGARA